MKTYYPERYIDIPASLPHPPDTVYRVSIGYEDWGKKGMVRTSKIQIAYAGKVAGRKNPSFPENANDIDLVLKALSDVQNGAGIVIKGKV